MALSSSFQERLELMERTRIQRLSLLQEERELQASKYQTLESKRSSIKFIEQRCLSLEQKIATQNFRISVLNSQIEDLESEHNDNSKKFKELKCEMEELEKVDKEKQRLYELKGLQMKEFEATAERFLPESRTHLDSLRKRLNELKSTFVELQRKNGLSSYSEITTAENRKAELVAAKEKLAKSLASNYELKSWLLNQIQNLPTIHNQGRL